MKNLRIFHAPFLQMRIRPYVLCDKCGRGDAEHVYSKFLVIHQFRPGHTHELDADAHEPDVVDVRRDVRTRPGKADPATERLRLGIDAVAKLRRQVVVNNKLAVHDALSFGVPAALKSAGFPEPSHLRGKTFYDGVEKFFLVRQQLFLGDFQAFVLALFVNQGGNDARYWIAQRCVEYRPQPGIDSAFHLQEEHRGVAHAVQKPRTSIGSRHWSADVRIHGTSDGRTI